MEKRPKAHPPDRQPVVLLIEDNDGDAMLAEMAFAAAASPPRLCRVDTGLKALSFLRKEGSYADVPSPDLIVLDLYLPAMNGEEILAELRADSRLSHLPVVVLTSSVSPYDVDECYRLGCNAYMNKPQEYPDLCEMLRVLCEYWFAWARLPTLP